jgi:hypothetical protein
VVEVVETVVGATLAVARRHRIRTTITGSRKGCPYRVCDVTGELVSNTVFRESHRCPAGVGAEQHALVPLAHIFGE